MAHDRVATHPLRELVERVPAVLFVAEDGRPVHVAGACERLLGRPGEDYVREPWRWDRDRAALLAVTTTRDEDGIRRTYGVLVAADPLRDATTELPGAGLLREHLRLACARARHEDRRVVLLHVGLDGLDLVNAGLGRAARDRVLREVARRVRDAMPDTALVAAGADGELAVMLADLEGAAEPAAEAAAGAVIAAAGRQLEADGERFELHPRVGASIHPGDAADAEALLRHAQNALREARAAHGGEVVFSRGGTSEALERLVLSTQLRRAIEHDELVLHFQPLFRLDGRAIAGVEALLRWRHPERGLLAPLRFIPMAEHTGLIEAIGRWVIGECCRQAAAWQDAGLHVPVSFNVSPRQFRDPGFVESLADPIAAHGLDPSLFMVEITETVLMRDPAAVEPVLAALRRLGVRLAIDDFGTGHSSLARLRDIDVDVLKIDRSFLQHTPRDARATRLMEAALDLAEALGLTPVAEGVETAEQEHLLTARGCRFAQGFHLGRPLPAGEVTELLGDARAGVAPASRWTDG